ncbi:DUF4269 domain-containing protein [Pseudoteredinibacter isoporae]|uniref:DUF4269 domain-containing protein n=1 Tax=Pseudoteredinibacter isoporae TaxID=570281 RepID=UPI0031074C1D
MSDLANVHDAIANLGIEGDLSAYGAEVVSTLLLGFHSPKSDIDVVCCYSDQSSFATELAGLYGALENFELKVCQEYCLCRFYFQGFQFEIYGEETPVIKQNAYRHFQIMRRVKMLSDEKFARNVRALRRQGFKPEAAICQLLGIDGEPYHAILVLENKTNEALTELLSRL